MEILMNGSETYCLVRIAGIHAAGIRVRQGHLDSQLLPSLRAAGASLWGAFAGLFGLAADEVFLMTSWQSGSQPSSSLQQAVAKSQGLSVAAKYDLTPTVRPTNANPQERDGLYVFRLFQVETKDIEEFISLSAKAWTTINVAKGWQSEPLGLFAPIERSEEQSVLVLVTWYDGFQSWEGSRAVAPGSSQVSADFVRRSELTINTTAYATRLMRV
jgi:hypothetical protein